MIFTLKIILLIFIAGLGTVGYSVFNMFKSSFKTEDYKNSSILGRMISQLLFIGISTGIISVITFLFIIIFSKVTIG